MANIDERALDERLGELETARTWSPRVLAKLEAHVRGASDEELFRVNPFAYAADKGMKPQEAVDLYLHAAKAGLFSLDWTLVCSCCAASFRSFRALSEVVAHFRCNMCHHSTDVALDDWVQVCFTVAPTVRRIRYHDLDGITAQEFYDHVLFCHEGRFFETGATIPDAWRYFFVSALELDPGQTKTVTATFVEGGADLLDLRHGASALRMVEAGAPPLSVPLQVRVEPGAVVLPEGPWPPGEVTLEVTSTCHDRTFFYAQSFSTELMQSTEPPHLRYEPFLSGRTLLTTQTFRDLYRFEVVDSGAGLVVRDLTFLFTDLKGSTELYDRVGDLNAFTLVRQHFALLQDVVAAHGGAVVKTIGDAVMATFPTPGAGCKAALDMHARVGSLNEAAGGTDIVLKIGLHRGPAIAVALNDRVDYFGQTVNIAARIQGLAGAGETCLSEVAFKCPTAADVTAAVAADEELATLKGVHGMLKVYRVMADKLPRAGAA